jgi:hypothetical protein
MSSNITDLWTSENLKQKKKIQTLVFPSGIGYDKQNNKVRTNRVNALFSSIPLISNGVDKLKNGEPIPMNQFSVSVTSTSKSSNFLEGLNSIINYNSAKKYSQK